MADARIKPAASPEDIAHVQQLWREYWESFGLPLEFQGFDEELEGLPGIYAQDGGCLLLAIADNEPAGTIALRRLDRMSGELKRLYVAPRFRGRRFGRQLLEAVIGRAKVIQYDCLYADTLPIMTEALGLYERAGFERIGAYSNTPNPGAIYLKLRLVEGRGTPDKA